MSEQLPDTAVLGRAWCPGCEPHLDPMLQILDVRYCSEHFPSRVGLYDEAVKAESYLSGSAEAGGDVNRLWCDLLHRKPPRKEGFGR